MTRQSQYETRQDKGNKPIQDKTTTRQDKARQRKVRQGKRRQYNNITT